MSEIQSIKDALEAIYQRSNAVINRRYSIYGEFKKGEKKDRFLGDFINSYRIRKNIYRKYKKSELKKIDYLINEKTKLIDKNLLKFQRKYSSSSIKIKREINAIKHKIKWLKEDISYTGRNFVRDERIKGSVYRHYRESEIIDTWLSISYCRDMILVYLKQIEKKVKNALR